MAKRAAIIALVRAFDKHIAEDEARLSVARGAERERIERDQVIRREFRARLLRNFARRERGRGRKSGPLARRGGETPDPIAWRICDSSAGRTDGARPK